MSSQGMFSIGGIASGLDTHAIIEQLMLLERQPVVRLQNTQKRLQDVDTAWGQVNTRLSALRTAVDAISRPDRFTDLVAVSSSDTDAVSVTRGTGSNTGSLTFGVSQLATAHQLGSGTFASTTAPLGPGTFEVTVGGTTTSIDLEGKDLTALARDLNAAKGGFTASVVKVGDDAHRLVLTSATTGTASELTVTSDLDQFQAGGQPPQLRTLQTAQNAVVTLGTGPDAITIERASNTITDLVPGASVTLKKVTTGQPVTVTSTRDVDGAVTAIKSYVDAVNAAIKTIGDLSKYDPVTQTGGLLQGDPTARKLLGDLRDAISAPNPSVSGLTSGFQVGLSIDRYGNATLDETKLRAALEQDFDAVGRLFGSNGTATSAAVSAVTGTSATVPGTYEVQVTTPPAVAAVSGTYTPPAEGTTRTFRITSGAIHAEVTLDDTHQSADDALAAIRTALSAAGVTGVVAELADGGQLSLRETRYGSARTFSVTALDGPGGEPVDASTDDVFGLAGTHAGVDVVAGVRPAGSSEAFVAMTGTGRELTGAAGGPAAGLSLTYGGTDAETFSVTYSRGLGGGMSATLRTMEGTGGSVARARQGITSQIAVYQTRIDGFEQRLVTRESTLIRQFTAMEVALSNLNAQSSWMASQINSLNAQTAANR